MLIFECPACQSKLQVADEHAGRTIQCPKCQQMATAPASASASVEAITVTPMAAPPSAAPPAPTAVTTPKQLPASPAPSPSGRRRDDDDRNDRPRRRRDPASSSDTAKAAGTGVGMILLILGVTGCLVVGVVGVLIALLVPAVVKVREAAARTQSTNNQKMIMMGIHSFHDANKRLPFNGTDENPQFGGQVQYSKNAVAGSSTSGSWGFQILPYVDQQPAFVQISRNQPMPIFMCPGRGRPPLETTNGSGAWTDYFYNNYINSRAVPDKADARDSRLTLVSITDGTSNTIFLGHGNISTAQYPLSGNVKLSTNIFNGGTTGTMRSGTDPEGPPLGPRGMTLSRDSVAEPGVGSWGGPFPQGGLMAMGDGTVRMFPYSMQNFGACLTPSGGEFVILPD